MQYSFIFLLLIGGAAIRKVVCSTRFRAILAQREANVLERKRELRNGDLIFQTSLSWQSKAIQEATGSEYSHCGIIYRDENGYQVFEAVQPVKSTPLVQWIARGKGARYTIKRLGDADTLLSEEALDRMRREARKFSGKDYDLTFEWSDEKIYCSELI